jgi:hypothetical protein
MTVDLEALSAELLVTSRVETAEGRGFDVSGLPLNAVLDICRRHWDELAWLFERLTADGTAVSLDQANWLGGALLSVHRRACRRDHLVCCRAPGARGGRSCSSAWPFPVQLDALDKIAALTFTSEMPPKKVIETVVRTLVGVAKPLIGSGQNATD